MRGCPKINTVFFQHIRSKSELMNAQYQNSELIHQIPIEIWQEILFRTTLKNQLKFKQVCKTFHHLQIHDFYSIRPKYLRLLTNNILTNYPFIRFLNVRNNPNITDISHLKKLVKLDARGFCGLTDKVISQFAWGNLRELNVSHNPNITQLNHMTSLTILNACGWSGVSDEGISQLNLTKLKV